MPGSELPQHTTEEKTAPYLLARIENLSPETFVLGSGLFVRARIFVPAFMGSSAPECALVLEVPGRDLGVFAVGQRMAAHEASIPFEVLDERLERVEAQAFSEVSEQGQWYQYQARLHLGDRGEDAPRYMLSLHCRLQGAETSSQFVVVQRANRAEVEQLFWCSDGGHPAQQFSDVACFHGKCVVGVDEVRAMSIVGLSSEQAAVSWSGKQLAAPSLFIQDEQVPETRVSGIVQAEQLPDPGSGEAIQILIEKTDGSQQKVSLPITTTKPFQGTYSQISSMYFDTARRLIVEGYFVSPHDYDLPRIMMRTARRTLDLSVGGVLGGTFERYEVESLDFSIFEYTQCVPWGFRFSLYPRQLGVRDGLLQLYAVTPNGAASAIGTPADWQKLSELVYAECSISAAQEKVLGGLRMAQYFSACASALRGSIKHKARRRAQSVRPERVVFASHNLTATEGAPRVLYQLVSYIRNAYPEVQCLLLSGERGELLQEYEALGVQVEVCDSLHVAPANRAYYRDAFSGMLQCVREFQADFLYANTIASFWAVEAAHRLAIPSLWAVHESKPLADWGIELDSYYFRKLVGQLRQCENMLFVAEASRALLAPWVNAKQQFVVSNGVDLDAVATCKAALSPQAARRQLEIAEDELVISIVGTTTYRKGQDVFLKAVARLRRHFSDKKFLFLIVGAREIPFLDQLRTIAAELELDASLRIVPETDEVGVFYRASDICVMCSREESAPLVSLESMAHERPLVSTNVFGLAEQLRHGENALVFESENDEDLFEKLCALVVEPELRVKLARQAARDVQDRFSLKHAMQRQWDCILKSYTV